MNNTIVKLIGSAGAAVVGFVVVAVSPKIVGEILAGAAAGVAVWKFVASWELKKLFGEVTTDTVTKI